MFRPGTLDELKSSVSSGKGFAKANLFHVQLPKLKFADTRGLSIMCTSVTLPSKQLQTVERVMCADFQQVVHGFINPEVSMTFRVLNDQVTRQYFEYWQENIINQYGDEGRYEVNYADEYVFPVHIYQLERGTKFPIVNKNVDLKLGPVNINVDLDLDAGISGKANYHWVLDRAYPKDIVQETLGDGEDGISQFTVQFSYKSWKGERIDRRGQLGVTATADVSTDIGSQVGNKIYDILG